MVALCAYEVSTLCLLRMMANVGVMYGTNYIIFRNVEIFKRKKINLKENKESDGTFGNISFVEMESSNLLN
jgi:hypothetical protein